MMNRHGWKWTLVALAAVGLTGCGKDAAEVEFRYAKVEKGEIIRSISANGVMVALTTVDVKSQAGGKVMKLLVDEGATVKKGDVVAQIDPTDTRALYEQAEADLQSAQARVSQAGTNLELERVTTANNVRQAESDLAAAKARLARATDTSGAQPTLTSAAIRQAEANLEAQRNALRELEIATQPQAMRDAEVAVDRARAELTAAENDLQRQTELVTKGYVAVATLDRSKSAAQTARAAIESAKTRMANINAQQTAQLAGQRARVKDAQAALDRARANQIEVPAARQALKEAQEAVRRAEIQLARARGSVVSVEARRQDIATARASTVRNRVTAKNARTQLDNTTVLAPRDGVVTLKYLEEGTVIPPGTSVFAQGTSIVQISDVSRMFVDCQVDEADVAQVRAGQKVRVLLEAYPGKRLRGVVARVNPAALTTNNITAVKVRVEVRPDKDVRLMPGMTASCEFLTLEKKDVIVVPSQAIIREGDKAFVRIKSKDPLKPERREVKLGESGNEGTEILSGLEVGFEIVTAEIDLKKLREIQTKMEQAQQGGGLAGGNRGGPSGSRASGGGSGAGGGGGSRGGGGGGGGSR
jgi:HlyD family secretion protein